MPLVSGHSQCPLSVFECADPMRNIDIFKLWSYYIKIGLLFYVFWTVHLLKFFLIKPLKRSVGFAYNSNNLDHWISQLWRYLWWSTASKGSPWMVRCTVFPTFLEQGLLIMAIQDINNIFFPIEIFISFVCYEIGIV